MKIAEKVIEIILILVIPVFKLVKAYFKSEKKQPLEEVVV